jgi:hypothetical protein
MLKTQKVGWVSNFLGAVQLVGALVLARGAQSEALRGKILEVTRTSLKASGKSA